MSEEVKQKDVIRITSALEFLNWSESHGVKGIDLTWTKKYAEDMNEEVFLEQWKEAGRKLFKEIKKVVK